MPISVVDPTVIVITEVPAPGAPIVEGLKLMVVPVGAPLADNEIELLNPPLIVVVSVDVPCVPCITLKDDGEAEMENVDPAVTVRDTVVDC